MDTNLNKILKNRYEIKERISSGGMSTIYLAYDVIAKKNIVLKILYKHLFNNHKTKTIFLNEIKITSQLKHKNIIKIYDYFVFDGFWCLVFEYIEGISLRKFLIKKNSLSEKETINIALQILEALTLAQSYKIIHRDIKPENILLIDEKKVKILDFGISVDKYFPEDIFKAKIIGSVKYISPEIIANQEKSNNQSDLYSLGVMLFEMLVGKTPFTDKDPLVLIKKHLYTTIPRVSSYQPKISQQMENVIIKATAKNTTERYQNTHQMILDLQKCLNPAAKKIQPLFLLNQTYQGKIENSIFAQSFTNITNFFWLKKKFLFAIIFSQLTMFVIVLFKLIIDFW